MDLYYNNDNYSSYDEYNPQDTNPFFADVVQFIIDKFNSIYEYLLQFINYDKIDKISDKSENNLISNNENILQIHDIEENGKSDNIKNVNDDELGCTLIFNSKNINKSQSESVIRNYKKKKSDEDIYEILDFTNKDRENYMKELKKSTSVNSFF